MVFLANVQKRGRCDGELHVSPLPERRPQLDALWREMVSAARGGPVPAGLDPEDLAAEAIARLVADPAEGSTVPLEARGRRKVQDARAEVFRFRDRREEPVLVESLEQRREDAATDDDGEAGGRRFDREPGADDPAFALVDALLTIRQEISPDAATYARCWSIHNMTLEEIAQMPGWNTQRVERARRAVKRHADHLASIMLRDESR